MKINKLLIAIISMNISLQLYAETNMVAKIILLRGQVKAKFSDGSVVDVKENQDIPEGAVLQTAEKSFAKLIFIDKSQMNLGPSSQMVINAFPKKEAGIITLVKGQIRSQVTKDYMEIDDKNKSKLFIKTNTAALGIRGTDFQVNYNPENQNTALITFEGKVAMSHIDKNIRDEAFDQSKLEKVVSSTRAVMVTSGQVSAVNLNVAERAMVPTVLAPSQIEALKINETGLKDNSKNENREDKQFRNPIPPGTDGAAFTNNSNEVEKSVSKIGGSEDIVKNTKDNDKASSKTDSNGFFNDKTGEYKLPAGSIIDLKTVNIIPPPVNAAFDPNTKTYIVPENLGRVDKTTGEYKAPEGLKLEADGKFKIDTDKLPAKKDDKKEITDPKNPEASAPPKDGRLPASLPGVGPAPTGIYDSRSDLLQFAVKYAPTINDKPIINYQLKAIAQDKITTTETVNQNNSNLSNTSTSTKVKFILNAQ